MGYVVGLTGGIGSGKSTVAHRFAALGANLSDADEVSHRITEKGAPGWHAIAAEFGPAYFTAEGELDRAKLREAVFSEPALKVRLESILHPLIGAAMQSALAAWRAPYGILMVPLLLESGRYRDRIDRLLVVDCTEEEQVRRVAARSGLPENEVRAIMATQVPREARLAAADDVVDNSGPLPRLDPQIARLDRFYRREAARRAADPRGNNTV